MVDEIEYEDEYNNDYDVDNPDSDPKFLSESIYGYAILKSTDVEKLRTSIIEKFMEYSSLSKEDATIVLINYQWNIDKLFSCWYDNVDDNLKNCGLADEAAFKSRDATPTLTSSSSDDICRICESEPIGNSSYSLLCGHKFCTDCWRDYITFKMEDPLTCVVAKCPKKGCNMTIPETVFYQFLTYNPKLTQDYKKALYKNFTDCNSDIKWCPAPDCGICVSVPGHGMKEIECECKTVFCFKCGMEGHRPCDCAMIEAWNKKNKSECENVKWLIANTKQCPSCHKYIEKNQGCNHMTCRKEAGGCGYEFCWICLGEWKPHGTSYYQCTRYDKEKEVSREEFAKNAKLELEKYVYYFERYMNHQKSQELGSKKLLQEIQIQSERFRNMKLIPYEEVKFMEQAVETVIHGRRTLKNTYVFGYYLIKCNENALFEHEQFLLDSHTDRLHGMMEGDMINKILSIEHQDEFSKTFLSFRNNVINLMSAIKTFKENLLSDIENKMLGLVDYKAFMNK